MAGRATRRGVMALAVAGGVVLASWGAWRMSVDSASPADARVTPRVAGPRSPLSSGTSLAGTTPDGGAEATPADILRPTPELIRLFEYYLTTVGERPLADIRAQIERDLDGRLGPNAARQAKDVLSRYLGYKAAMSTPSAAGPAAAAASGAAVDRLRAAWQAMRATRARFFTAAEAAALFAPDDAMAQVALDRLAAAQDPAAPPEERRRRLAAVDLASPADARAREDANLVNRLNDETQRILAAGGSEDDVYRMRAAAVSPEAANRLADLDRDEAGWNARIAAYLRQRATLQATTPESDAAIARLRTQLFTPDEQRRLPAYER